MPIPTNTTLHPGTIVRGDMTGSLKQVVHAGDHNVACFAIRNPSGEVIHGNEVTDSRSDLTLYEYQDGDLCSTIRFPHVVYRYTHKPEQGCGDPACKDRNTDREPHLTLVSDNHLVKAGKHLGRIAEEVTLIKLHDPNDLSDADDQAIKVGDVVVADDDEGTWAVREVQNKVARIHQQDGGYRLYPVSRLTKVPPSETKRAFKFVALDGTTRFGDYEWPIVMTEGKGAITEPQEVKVDPTSIVHNNTGGCPRKSGDGLCLATTLTAAESGGLSRWHSIGLWIEYETSDLLGFEHGKLRVSKCKVVGAFNPATLIIRGFHWGGSTDDEFWNERA